MLDCGKKTRVVTAFMTTSTTTPAPMTCERNENRRGTVLGNNVESSRKLRAKFLKTIRKVREKLLSQKQKQKQKQKHQKLKLLGRALAPQSPNPTALRRFLTSSQSLTG